MFPLNYALAAALLTAPADAPTDGIPDTRPALRQVALAWEILDRREARYLLSSQSDYASDLRLLKRRYRILIDAPYLCDHVRFPERPLLNEACSFNYAYQHHLEARRFLDPEGRWDLHEAIKEAERIYSVWDTVRTVKNDYYYITVRRESLKHLREMLGDAAYFAGCLPSPVPAWRLARAD